MNSNQDEVAARLLRCSIDEMHFKMKEYGSGGNHTNRSWAVIANLFETRAFLESHGWSFYQYIYECSRSPDRYSDAMIYWFAEYAKQNKYKRA